jgi:hypothetical protein
MTAIDFLATSLNRRDEVPNQELASEIIKSVKSDWVKELVDNLNNNDKNIQSDCIKVLYEIGQQGAPGLIAPYYKDFIETIQSKNNRLVWGAMYALDSIATINPEGIYKNLGLIMKVVDKGSVITIDCGVEILAKLAAIEEYSETAFPLLYEQLKKCPPKQLPMYAEKSVIAVKPSNKELFTNLLLSRMEEMERDTQKVRLKKIIKLSEKF